MLESLKEQVCQANLDLVAHGLVTLTWGNVSGISDDRQHAVIKPSGVPYDDMRPEHMVVVDLDGNEAVDCFIMPTGKSDAKVYLNDGDGHFHDGTIVLPTRSTVWTDLDHDGDLDLFDSYARVWYERRTLGDANADGRFDSADIVALFQAGQYEDWLAKNSIFQTGDFNADGEFDSADLVYAFAYGVYVA